MDGGLGLGAGPGPSHSHSHGHGNINSDVLPPAYTEREPTALPNGHAHANNATPNPNPSPNASSPSPAVAAVQGPAHLLQPRVAVMLGVSPWWHPLLFVCRLVSIVPALRWGFPSALRVGYQVKRLLDGGEDGGHCCGGGGGCMEPFEASLRLTESVLAVIWCCASTYLSFFFTDCLMSRWLVNYSPLATLVRLISIDSLNWYLTSQVLYLSGGFDDPRMVLPAWVAISATLTVLYHITQRKINIRKETSISISVFSLASFTSMVALLAQAHSNRSGYDIPLVTDLQWLWAKAKPFVEAMMEYGNVTKEL